MQVSDVTIIEQHSGTTGRVRLGVDYASGDGPSSVFVKLQPFDERQRKLVEMTDMGRKEARFYREVASEVPVRIPGVYFAQYGTRPTEYVMVLEDLQAGGSRFARALEPLADDQGPKVVETLAKLHAHFWDDRRFDTSLSWVEPAMRGEMGTISIGNAQRQFATDSPPVFDELCGLYIEHSGRISELLDEGAPTLIHGDTHGGNQFLDGTVVGFYDWAVISRSPGIRDVAIYLGNSCPPEVRRRDQDHLIRHYRDTLLAGGVDAPSLDELWRRYRIGVLSSWVAAATTASMGDTWQPIEIGMLGMSRATQACADLDTVEAIREAL